MTTATSSTRRLPLGLRAGIRLRAALAAGLGLALGLVPACAGDDAEPAAEDSTGDREEDRYHDMSDVELASEAYVAGYPLVVTTRTLQTFSGLIGVNQLVWQSALSGPETRVVVAPNRDTLYSVAVLDLRAEPVVLTLPEVTDRYYTYQLLDAWSESFAYLGTRATEGRAGQWLITPPAWDGEVPDGMDQIEAPTPQLFLLGRFLVDDEADIANVTAISEKSSLELLSEATGQESPPPPPPLGEPVGTPQDIPTDATFFDELGDALAINPPTTELQRDLFARSERLGISPSRHPTEADGSDIVATLDDGAAQGDQRIADAIRETRGEPGDNGSDDEGLGGAWALNPDLGQYGDSLLLRAVVARIGWGANVVEEAAYALTRTDADGKPLSGESTYRIRFEPGELPPVDAFWSLTAYGDDLFFVEHPSDRYAIGDRTPGLDTSEDGGLDIVLSHTEPAADPDGEPVNWLPVPEGPFVLMLRLYLPQEEVIQGEYELPPIERSESGG